MTALDHVDARLVDMPYPVRGLSAVDENGDPMIYLNARHSAVQHQLTYEHELRHLLNDDTYNQDSIQIIEARASGITLKSEYELHAEAYQAFLERSYTRGLELFGLQRDDPFWSKLFDIWDFRTHKDRYEGVIINGIDRYNRRQTGHMVNLIFK